MQMDLHAEHTWDEVLSIQQRFSQQRESQVTKGFKGFLRTPLRRFCDNSDSFKAWLQLLPTQSNYLSVLCGGLTLVLGVGRRRAIGKAPTATKLMLTRPHIESPRFARASRPSSMIFLRYWPMANSTCKSSLIPLSSTCVVLISTWPYWTY